MFFIPQVSFSGTTFEELKARAQAAAKRRGTSEVQSKMKQKLRNSSTFNKSSSMGSGMKNKAYSVARMKAENGDRNSQFALAGMYYQGIMIKKNYMEAIKWYKKAASQGHTKAQFNLAYMYFDGRGVPKDHDIALKWFLQAGESRDGKAELYLGLIYDEKNNHEKAFHWYYEAAEQDYPAAQYKLALKYRDGKGCSKNLKKYIYYLRLSATKSEAHAQYELGLAHIKGLGVPKDMYRAKKWIQSAYLNGSSRAKKTMDKYKWYVRK